MPASSNQLGRRLRATAVVQTLLVIVGVAAYTWLLGTALWLWVPLLLVLPLLLLLQANHLLRCGQSWPDLAGDPPPEESLDATLARLRRAMRLEFVFVLVIIPLSLAFTLLLPPLLLFPL